MLDHLYPHMLHESFVIRIRQTMLERAARLARIKTGKQAANYVRDVRAKVKRCFSAMPGGKTPLNAKTTGVLDRKTYTVEKIVFESRPDFLVTGNYYLPKKAAGKIPCVLGVCGHSIEGKAAVPYQSFCQGLAGKGFAVFIIDPISQGERRQFYRKDGLPLPGLCPGHNMMGNQMQLIGDFFGAWRAWDAIRGLDYLLARPEIDKTRVGVTGNSGGGTLTTYVTALDPRVTMAAPSCYICSYLANIQNELPADSEQDPPGALAAGLDHADLLLAYAPRPTMVLAQKYDYFDARYARMAYEEIARIHRLLGSPETAAYFEGPTGHGFSRENREAMYAFFMQHAGIDGSAKEPTLQLEDPSDLFALKNGETAKHGSRRVFEITAESAARLIRSRKRLADAELIKTARGLLGIRPAKALPFARRVGYPSEIDKKFMPRSQFALETDENILTIVTVLGREQFPTVPPTGPVDVFVGNETGATEVIEHKKVRAYLGPKRSLAVVDPRGLGQSRPGSCHKHDFFGPYGSDFFYASESDMFGESLLGKRVQDVSRTLDFLITNGARDLRLIGRGMGSVIVAFVGLLHVSGPRVEIFDYLPSYRMLAECAVYRWPLSSLLRGVLPHFDLPDVYRALGGRLKKTDPWDAMMRPLRKKQLTGRKKI